MWAVHFTINIWITRRFNLRVPVCLDHDGPNMIILYVCTCTGPFGPWWTENDYTFTYVRVPVRLDHDGPNMIILLRMYVYRSVWTMMDRKWLFFYVCTCAGPFGPWWTEHDYSLRMFVYRSVWTLMDRTWLYFYVCTCTGPFGPWWTENDCSFSYVRVPVHLDHDGPKMIVLLLMCVYLPVWTMMDRTWFLFTYVRVPVRLDHDGPNMIVLLRMYVYRSFWTRTEHDYIPYRKIWKGVLGWYLFKI